MSLRHLKRTKNVVKTFINSTLNKHNLTLPTTFFIYRMRAEFIPDLSRFRRM